VLSIDVVGDDLGMGSKGQIIFEFAVTISWGKNQKGREERREVPRSLVQLTRTPARFNCLGYAIRSYAS
jgi:hypothetical protein